MSNIIIFTGPMFAGKTTKLFDVIKFTNVQKYAVLKPKLDTRSHYVKTHNGAEMKCFVFEDLEKTADVLSKYDVILIDEAQFFPVETIKFILSLNCSKYYFACLDKTFRNDPFPATQYLQDIVPPQNQCHLTPMCRCGRLAHYTKYIGGKNVVGDVLIGGDDKYMPVCEECFNN